MRKVEFAAGIVFALQREQALPMDHFGIAICRSASLL
jgi:hypothetical protein